ncbi:SLBB domain-containing protein [bacterium]|nr:SLBB domain-containing protein [bacterium]
MFRISFITLALCFTVHLYSQEKKYADTTDSKPLSAKVERKVRPGERLQISVYGHDELPKEAIVGADGTIKYPFMKDIKVDGMTLEQFSNVLAARLSQYIGGRAEVVVAFAQEEMIEVIVLGQVNSPGALKIPKNHTIQGAISAAGGATPRCDLNKTRIIRRNHETGLREDITIPLETIIIETGNVEKLKDLQDGDIIFVPAIYGAVYANVLGAVRNPGNYPLFPGANVIDVVFLAGGPEDDASIRSIKLVRRIGATQTEQIVDIETVLKAKGGQVPLVEPGDIIFVPAKKFTFKTILTVLQYTITFITAYYLYKQATRN